jgi:hypothetical protein
MTYKNDSYFICNICEKRIEGTKTRLIVNRKNKSWSWDFCEECFYKYFKKGFCKGLAIKL